MRTTALKDRPVEAARGRLLDVVRLIHAALPESDLSARQRLEIRRDLLFLVDESRREIFRPAVAEVLCTAVLAEVARSHPAVATKALRVLGVA
jgi:hypothetical protein